MASFALDQSRLMMNVHNRVHHLEHYITGALMPISQIITKVYILVTDLQDRLPQPVTQITAIHNASHLTTVLRQIVNMATDNQIIALMDRIVEPLNVELHIPGHDGTYYPDYHQLRATILNEQVYAGDLRERLAVWIEDILTL
ncbi:hypothetical protein JB92DRAFT_3131328 [Gautieria morchelliformis]|nr:hypothetical protein JB92DRAFT_3131328 [Gautieria morchelliformis]